MLKLVRVRTAGLHTHAGIADTAENARVLAVQMIKHLDASTDAYAGCRNTKEIINMAVISRGFTVSIEKIKVNQWTPMV